VTCAETIQDRPGQPAYEMLGIKLQTFKLAGNARNVFEALALLIVVIDLQTMTTPMSARTYIL